MSTLGQKQTCAVQEPMSALPPTATAKADMKILDPGDAQGVLGHCLGTVARR
jgi:hypothetical protein